MDDRDDWIRGHDRRVGAAATVVAGVLALAAAAAWFADGGAAGPYLLAIGGAIAVLFGLVALNAAVTQRRRAYRVVGPGTGLLEVTDPVAGTRSLPLDALVGAQNATGNQPAHGWWVLTFADDEVSIQGEPGQRVMTLVRQRRPDVELVVRSLGHDGSGAP